MRTPNTKNFTISDALESLNRIDSIIKKSYRYTCGVEYMKQGSKGLFGFFLSPDYQNEALYWGLIRDGWRNSGYSANYYWKVRRGSVILSYTEGDINIYTDTV